LEREVDRNDRNSKLRDIGLGIGILVVDHNSKDRDDDLQDNIDDEEDARIAGDRAVQQYSDNNDRRLANMIGEETDNRESADGELQNNIDDVDTNSQDRDTTINQYINDNSGKWSTDNGGMSRNSLAHYLTGEWNMDWIFKREMSYLVWLKDIFVQKDVYEAKIAELESTLDKLTADIKKLQDATGTEPANEFDVAMVTSGRTEEIVEVDGFKCDSNMKDCTKIVEAPPSEQELATQAAQQEEEQKSKEQQEWDDELEWHTRICERLHVKWHCDAMNEMQVQ